MNSNEVVAVPLTMTARKCFPMAKIRGVFCAALGVAAVLFAVTSQMLAQTETVLYRFCSLRYCADGTTPAATLSLDGQGNLYGAAAGGNSQSYAGVVFKVNSNGGESLVYDFTAVNQGVAPNGALAQDASGNFYGTTAGGGYDKGKCKKYYGCGVVYRLSGGVEQVLYAFKGSADGLEPNGGPVLDASGNIYGTTYRSVGSSGSGIVFKVSPDGSETVLHQFGTGKADGKRPTSGLAIDNKGNLYGTTSEGERTANMAPDSTAPVSAVSSMRSQQLGRRRSCTRSREHSPVMGRRRSPA